MISVWSAFELKRQEIINAEIALKELRNNLCDWLAVNKNEMKQLMPKRGKVYRISEDYNFTVWHFVNNLIKDKTYYFKPVNVSYHVKRFTESYYNDIMVTGEVLDENYKVVVRSGQIAIRYLEEVNEESVMSRLNTPTKIYVMLDRNTGYYKIGRSVNPEYRERTLQSEKPTIVMLFHYEGTHLDEKRLHDMFYNKRIRGEWFDLSGSDIDKIKRYFYKEYSELA